MGRWATLLPTRPRPPVVIELKGGRHGPGPRPFQWPNRGAAMLGLPQRAARMPLWGIVSNFVSFRLYHRDGRPWRMRSFGCGTCANRSGSWISTASSRSAALSQPGTGPSAADAGPAGTDGKSSARSRRRAVRGLQHEPLRSHRAPADPPRQIAGTAPSTSPRRFSTASFHGVLRGSRPAAGKVHRGAPTRRLPPFSKVTNPRWQKLSRCCSMPSTKATPACDLPTGYNGGLFRHDPRGG